MKDREYEIVLEALHDKAAKEQKMLCVYTTHREEMMSGNRWSNDDRSTAHAMVKIQAARLLEVRDLIECMDLIVDQLSIMKESRKGLSIQ